MAEPVYFPGANRVLGPPPGADNVGTLHTFTNGVCSVSCWQLTPEEIAEVVRTGRLYCSILSGQSQPPVFIGGEDQVRELCADYGVWRRL